jgi:mevalonate kinase
MILGTGRAPGKVILFGEHAVVYGRPALAVPVTQVAAEATVEPGEPGAGLTIWAADLGEQIDLRTAPADHPLAAAARLALAHLGLPEPDWKLTVRSTIPIASGMGSGAAVSAAIVRALAEANQRISESANQRMADGRRQMADDESATSYQLSAISYRPSAISYRPSAIGPEEVSALVYEVERLHHGTPSGVDNTVIAYGQPVYFVRGQPPQTFPIGRAFTLAIADSGIASPTKIAVGDVRQAWQREPRRFEALFDRVAAVVEAARAAIFAGEPARLGPLMDDNHALLQQIGVSCPELDVLVAAARAAGALGAKLSGAGRGGNMIALVTAESAPQVADALRAAGAVRVIVTDVGAAANQRMDG